jgi:hypothetical protein
MVSSATTVVPPKLDAQYWCLDLVKHAPSEAHVVIAEGGD